MELIEKASITLLVQGAKKVFCYFEIPQKIKNNFDEVYGEEFWKKSKPILKVFQVENENIEEIKKIYLDKIADNWYIELENDNIKIFLELGREHLNGMYVSLAKSNEVVTPPEAQSTVKSVTYLDLSNEDSIHSVEDNEISLALDSTDSNDLARLENEDLESEQKIFTDSKSSVQSMENQELNNFNNSNKPLDQLMDKQNKTKSQKLIDKDEIGNTEFFDEYFESMKKSLKLSSSK
ncbi:DUF4912 domain-containing protein [Clostridium grantii]|uniref:Uncharacterized protein n=1 Tax=Clostridium grantii DSM 8605 TaxID=1121316 RepID=A0A1M5RF69_9CLOT|nr:DUF4912 domain-containing protein [Clostridium grantii]SHH24838.1 protein of unknown function [Clostridium grantii DSM 8605]